MANPKPANQAGIRLVHGLHLTSYGDECSTRQRLAVGVDDALYIAANRAKIAVLRRPVDIDHAAYVVVVDDSYLTTPLHRSNIRENLRIALRAASDGDILNVLDRLDSVLRGLRNQVVVHAVLPVDEEHRRDLKAPAQRVQHTRSNVFFLVSRLQCFGPVHSYIERRIIERLLDMQVGQPGDLMQLRHDVLGNVVIGLNVVSFDLNVDRRGQAEIENLGHDVGRQKIEGRPGKLAGKLLAKGTNILRRGVMVLAQRHQHIGVIGAEYARSGVHQVVGTEWQADVVQNVIDFIRRHLFANGGLYQIGKLCRILNARPGLRADVQDELTAIGVGEEILPEPRRQEKDAEAESREMLE